MRQEDPIWSAKHCCFCFCVRQLANKSNWYRAGRKKHTQFCKYMHTHPSSVERFSENFDKKAVTYLIFFKNVIFEENPWAPSEVAEVANFGFHLILRSFHLEFSLFWVSRSFDLGDLGDLRRSSGNFFKNYIFEISGFQQKRWGMSQLSCRNFH